MLLLEHISSKQISTLGKIWQENNDPHEVIFIFCLLFSLPLLTPPPFVFAGMQDVSSGSYNVADEKTERDPVTEAERETNTVQLRDRRREKRF